VRLVLGAQPVDLARVYRFATEKGPLPFIIIIVFFMCVLAF
jgi:hypothetical protein